MDRTKMAAKFLTSAMTSLRNQSSSLEQLWRRLGSLVRSSWTSLLSDDLLRNFYLSLYNDAADPTRRPVATSAESRLNEPASGKPISVLALQAIYYRPTKISDTDCTERKA